MNILEKIICHKQQEVEARATIVPIERLKKSQRLFAVRDFKQALQGEEIKIIAGDTSGKELKSRWLTAEINNFKISNIYPNPFNPVAQIDYKVDQAGDLRLSIYNLVGQEVAVLYSGQQVEGTYNATWDASMFASGVYYIRMIMNGQMETTKAMLIK